MFKNLWGYKKTALKSVFIHNLLHLPYTISTASKFILFDKGFHNRRFLTSVLLPGYIYAQSAALSLALSYFVHSSISIPNSLYIQFFSWI